MTVVKISYEHLLHGSSMFVSMCKISARLAYFSVPFTFLRFDTQGGNYVALLFWSIIGQPESITKVRNQKVSHIFFGFFGT